MKKTEIVPMEKHTRYCDYCEAKIASSYSSTKCMLCKKDICYDCSVVMEECCDNPPAWCKHCYEIGKPYRAEIGIECERHEKTTKDIHKRWNEEALK